jgi:hypothetical protein
MIGEITYYPLYPDTVVGVLEGEVLESAGIEVVYFG